MKRKNFLIVLIMTFMILFVMIFSASFVIAEKDHDCTGKDCPICYQINFSRNMLHTYGKIVSVTFFIVPIVFLPVIFLLVLKKILLNSSLVTLQVKLLN